MSQLVYIGYLSSIYASSSSILPILTTAAILVAKNGSTVTATVLIRFTQNLACVYLHSLLGLGLQFSVLRHQRPVKIAVEKTVKTGSDMNSKKNVD